METSVRMAFGSMLVLGNWTPARAALRNNPVAHRSRRKLSRVTIQATPQWRRANVLKFLSAINNLPRQQL